MNRNLSQNSELSHVNVIADDHKIDNKTEILNDQLKDDETDLLIGTDKNASRVLITGRFCLNKDNKYELECEATIDGVSVITHKGAHPEIDLDLEQRQPLKPEVQDHQIQTDLTKDDIISHDDFVYKICNQGLHPAELNLHILFKGNSAENINYDGRKIPCVVTTGKVKKTDSNKSSVASTGKIKKTNSNKSNVTDRQIQTGKIPSATKTKRPVTANKKIKANSKQSTPNLSPSRKPTHEKVNDDKAKIDKRKDKYKFSSFKPKIPPLKKKMETQNKNSPLKTESIQTEKPWKKISHFGKTKNEANKKEADSQEIKVLYQSGKPKPSVDSKYIENPTDKDEIIKEARPRSYSTALSRRSIVYNDDLEEVRDKKPLLGSVSKNNMTNGARTAYSLRKLVTGSESKVLPDVRKSPKPSNSKLSNKRSPPGSPKSKSVAGSPSGKPSSNDLRKSSVGSPKFSPRSSSPPKLATPSTLVSELPCREKCSPCRNVISGGDQRGVNTIEKTLNSSPKPLSPFHAPPKHPCNGKCTHCTKSRLVKDNQRGFHLIEKNSRDLKLSQHKRLSTESPKSSRLGSPPRILSPGEVFKNPCCGRCIECNNCPRNIVQSASPHQRSRTGSPTSCFRATSPHLKSANTVTSSNYDCSRHCPNNEATFGQEERQKKKKMLIERFIHQMDGESEVSINFVNKRNTNVTTSSANHTKVTVNIDGERELYDLMFRKNSNNIGNLTVKKTVKQNSSPDSYSPKSKKSRPNSNSNQQKMIANNNCNIESAHNGNVPASESPYFMGDEKYMQRWSKNGRGRGVSVNFNESDINKSKSNIRRVSPDYVPGHRSVPAALQKNKFEVESDDKVSPENYYRESKRKSVNSTDGYHAELPEKNSFQSNDDSNVPDLTSTNRKASKTNSTHAIEDRRSTFDSALGGAVDLPKRISTVEDEIRILSAHDVIYDEALDTLATSNLNELHNHVNGQLTKSMQSLLDVTDSLLTYGHSGSSRRGSGFGSNYTVSKVTAPDVLDLKSKHEQRLRHDLEKQVSHRSPPGHGIKRDSLFFTSEPGQSEHQQGRIV